MSENVINERFRLHEKIGEGGMAIVYRATDLDSGKEVALKMMKTSMSGTAQKRFAREFRASASVEHVNCVRVFDFAETRDCPFLTMELFRGQPITQLIGHEFPVIISALYQAASAVEHIHGQQIIHRDLKPTNLLTTISQGSDGRPQVNLKLADFGLARFYGTPSSLSIESGFVGTLAYSAPEQISSGQVDIRCDLYSLGVVCYELLTGRHPFERARQTGTQAMICAHLAEVPVSIGITHPNVPAELEDMVFSLMEKQPSKRPPSATPLKLLLADYLGIKEQVAGEDESTTFQIRWRQEAFVARERELEEVSALMTQSLSPIQFSLGGQLDALSPSVVFVTGEAGMGKSLFLREVARLARRHGANVFEGRCFEGNLAPYQTFVEIIRQLLLPLGHLGSLEDNLTTGAPHDPTSERHRIQREAASGGGAEVHSAKKETLQDVVRNYSAELLRISPDLQSLLPGKAFRQVDLSRETNYVLRAIATFFVEVATLHGTCLLIEDMHWVDQSSLDLLRHIASILHRHREQCIDSNRSYPRLFICCTARPDEAIFSRELERERYAKVVPLSALTLEETRQLVSLVLAIRPEKVSTELIDEVGHRCKGNPYFVTETLRLWQSNGRIIRSDGKWRLDSSDGSADWPDSVRGVLRSRLKTISPAGQQVLNSCAVIGSIVPVDVLSETVQDLSEGEFLDALDELLSRHVVFETFDPAFLEFSHDLLRELTYEQLATHRRRALHRRVGEVLEQGGKWRGSAEQLAGHFYAAGVRDKAFSYSIDAGESALSSYAVENAINHLTNAKANTPDIVDRLQHYRLYDLLGTALRAAGRPGEAADSYAKSLQYVDDQMPVARTYEKMGEVLFRVGDFDQAVELFDRALSEVGYKRPRSLVAAVASAVGSVTYQVWPRWLRWRSTLRGESRSRAIIAHDAFGHLMNLFVQRSIIRCGQAAARQFVLGNRIGDSRYLANAHAQNAMFAGAFSLNWIAVFASKRGLAYAMESGDIEVEAIAKGHIGSADYYGARLPQAERLLREALSVLDRRGDSWVRMLFYHNLRHLYAIRGDAVQEIAAAKVEMHIGETARDSEGACWGAYGVANALARTGKLDEAHQYIQRALGILSGKTNIIVLPVALQTYGFVHIQSGNYEAAREVLEQSRAMIEKEWAYVDYTIRGYPLLVESILGPHWHDRPTQISTDDARQSWRLCRRALFWGWRFPNYLPYALRVGGRTAFVLGKRRKAIDYLSRAIKAGECIGARFDVARACLDLSKLVLEGRQYYERRGRLLLEELGAALPVGED